MKIWIHSYQLQPAKQAGGQPRSGALLKVEWEPNEFGYSDLHPWPEFGEEPMDVQIESLASADFTKLCEISLQFNSIDREYRVRQRNAFLGMALPRSHRLVLNAYELTDENLKRWFEEGFTHIKLKVGSSDKADVEAFERWATQSPFRWRLDFNGRRTGDDFLKWWRNLDETIQKSVDFIEDPSFTDEIQEPGPWADDWHRQSGSSVKVIKPAREDAETSAAYSRIVFTHSLDHPLGQASALWAAAQFYREYPELTEVCGLAVPDVYKDDPFQNLWSCSGPVMKPTPGNGFGFDEMLRSLDWMRVF